MLLDLVAVLLYLRWTDAGLLKVFFDGGRKSHSCSAKKKRGRVLSHGPLKAELFRAVNAVGYNSAAVPK